MENVILSGFVIVGAILYLLFEVNKAWSKPDFSIKVFLKNHMWSSILNIACGITCVFAKEDMVAVFGFQVSKLGAVVLGIAGQKIFSSVVDFFSSKTKTKVGLNGE